MLHAAYAAVMSHVYLVSDYIVKGVIYIRLTDCTGACIQERGKQARFWSSFLLLFTLHIATILLVLPVLLVPIVLSCRFVFLCRCCFCFVFAVVGQFGIFD